MHSHYKPKDTPSIVHRSGNPNVHGKAEISFDSEGSSSLPSSLAQITDLSLRNYLHMGQSWLQFHLLKRWSICTLLQTARPSHFLSLLFLSIKSSNRFTLLSYQLSQKFNPNWSNTIYRNTCFQITDFS